MAPHLSQNCSMINFMNIRSNGSRVVTTHRRTEGEILLSASQEMRMQLKTEKLSHSKRNQYFLSSMKADELVGRTGRPLLPVQQTSEHIRNTSLSTPLKTVQNRTKSNIKMFHFSLELLREICIAPINIHPVTLHKRKTACRSS